MPRHVVQAREEREVFQFEEAGCRVKYVNQRINHLVFREPELLMENMERVTRFARAQIEAAGGDPDRETLTIVPTRDGKSFHRTPEATYWRMFRYIDGARTYDRVEDLRHVYAASKAFGRFQKMLARLPGGRLHETIPNFHHTPKRFEAFITALEADSHNRAREARAEIDFVQARSSDTRILIDLLEQGKLPLRITHNDTKLNNVMIDDATGEGICVIDLDTVMPGRG